MNPIPGLDPADPHFEETDPIVRLDETDAYYVDAIHTDANPLLSGQNFVNLKFGLPEPILPNFDFSGFPIFADKLESL